MRADEPSAFDDRASGDGAAGSDEGERSVEDGGPSRVGREGGWSFGGDPVGDDDSRSEEGVGEDDEPAAESSDGGSASATISSGRSDSGVTWYSTSVGSPTASVTDRLISRLNRLRRYWMPKGVGT